MKLTFLLALSLILSGAGTCVPSAQAKTSKSRASLPKKQARHAAKKKARRSELKDAPAANAKLPSVPIWAPPSEGVYRKDHNKGGVPIFAKRSGAEAKMKVLAPEPDPAEEDMTPQQLRAKELMQAAERKSAAEDYAGALKDAEAALLLQNKDAALHLLKANALNRLERFREAEDAALDAVRLSPMDSAIFDALAWARLGLGRDLDAVASASRSLELDPKNAFTYAVRAYAFERLGKNAEMLRDIEAAARLHPAAFATQFQNAQAGKRLRDDAGVAAAESNEVRFLMDPFTRKVVGWGLLVPAGLGLLLHLLLRRRQTPALERNLERTLGLAKGL